ncbi:unnamed protein product [Prorocentrum cordatum]|uniref:Uncharacterized protein n=1 Tax=Prorocentrum cordatum TaxID=2364126 RepID=A0ABN9SC67_9DINO|nr:unnamed protein product [Polarella glacialis]
MPAPGLPGGAGGRGRVVGRACGLAGGRPQARGGARGGGAQAGRRCPSGWRCSARGCPRDGCPPSDARGARAVGPGAARRGPLDSGAASAIAPPPPVSKAQVSEVPAFVGGELCVSGPVDAGAAKVPLLHSASDDGAMAVDEEFQDEEPGGLECVPRQVRLGDAVVYDVGCLKASRSHCYADDVWGLSRLAGAEDVGGSLVAEAFGLAPIVARPSMRALFSERVEAAGPMGQGVRIRRRWECQAMLDSFSGC